MAHLRSDLRRGVGLGYGVRVTLGALRGREGLRRLGVRGTRTEGEVVRGPRREGDVLHSAQVRYRAGPQEQTYRRAPLNADRHVLRAGYAVVVRYDPADPRRVVVERTQASFSPYTYLVCGVALCFSGWGWGCGAWCDRLAGSRNRPLSQPGPSIVSRCC
ncbi:DUF3592 domain-containing protein [Streptomyces sp. NPDC052016]|uniref:DUF3592 domain-containing protein n=1 Tax=Streptomyces sp. NPDC052016 TaxID=3365680 RepID=UPI0037D0CD8D